MPALGRWFHPCETRGQFGVWTARYGGAGDGLIRITPRPGGGSHLAVEWENTGARRLRDKVLLTALHKGPMGRVVSRLWASSLDRYAESEASP